MLQVLVAGRGPTPLRHDAETSRPQSGPSLHADALWQGSGPRLATHCFSETTESHPAGFAMVAKVIV